jgi:hypothetical protein
MHWKISAILFVKVVIFQVQFCSFSGYEFVNSSIQINCMYNTKFMHIQNLDHHNFVSFTWEHTHF